MIIPVRCFTCGRVIGEDYEEYTERVESGENAGNILDELGIDRYCCRRMFVSHKDLLDEVARYE